MTKRVQPHQTTIALPDAIDLIRFEKNLLQIGFFSAHDRRSNDPDLSRRIEQWVNRDGKKIRVSAEFRSTLGLPSTAEKKANSPMSRPKAWGFCLLSIL